MSLSSRHSSVLEPFGEMVLELVFLVDFTVSKVYSRFVECVVDYLVFGWGFCQLSGGCKLWFC